MDSLNKKERANFWVAVEYALHNDDVFLYVDKKPVNPAIGGYVGTKYIGMSPAQVEADCSGNFMRYSAVLFNGPHSTCIESVKAHTRYYIRRYYI